MSDDQRNGDARRQTGIVTAVKPKTKKPSMYKVLLLNDDYTPMEFVVVVLMRFFSKSQEEATQIMLHVHRRGVGRVIPFALNWRLGYHRVGTFRARSPRGFGHAGFGGSGAWADPDRDLAVALVLNSGTGTPFGDLRIVQIGSAALRCADRR